MKDRFLLYFKDTDLIDFADVEMPMPYHFGIYVITKCEL
ncbi:hypothetical protein SAMN05421800_1264 [Chryseobacterium balustinum]|uniref:Uncharacterized protein n=1 Tax=Chryseobacterium balustinum TaxID=246 RepID=A0ABY1LDT2_9FLAO|nr:hypothetical protein SAMN05421800_1264 [Chryseobacterium balustinum]